MDYTNLIPWTISLISLIIVILTYVRNGNKDRRTEINEDNLVMNGIKESLLKVNMKLDQVCATTNETRSDIKSLNKDMTEIDRRVSMMERDIKTAFNAIDELKGKVNNND